MAGSRADDASEEKYAAIVATIAAMPAEGGDAGRIARLIDANRDPDLFWAICEWGTMHPFAPRLQAMLEMLAHKDIALHPHAEGETLDQLAYHAPVSIVEAHIDRMEHLLAEDPRHADDCWTDLTQILTRRMAEAGRGDLAPRIAAIDAAVEEALKDEFP